MKANERTHNTQRKTKSNALFAKTKTSAPEFHKVYEKPNPLPLSSETITTEISKKTLK
jgi:hypothetical protein